MAGKTVKVAFLVSGMDCAACGLSIEKGLKAVPGVVKASVSYVLGKAVVEFDPKKTTPQKIKSVIEKTGYKVVE